MNNNDEKIGLFYGIASFVMWGIFPLYLKMISDINSLEILAHRFLWSVVFLFGFLVFKKRVNTLKRYILNKKTFLTLTLAGFFIGINWGVYIYAVNSDQILEASLGYFINPLMFIIFGAIFFKEKPSLIGKISIFLVFCAIAIQAINLGRLPFIAIILPLAFSIYGVLKKRISVPSIDGLFCETIVLAIISFVYLIILGINNTGNFGINQTGVILIFSGPTTILPLITFSLAAKRLNLSTIGYLQYISPTLTALLAVFVYDEKLGIAKLASFALIWLGLFLIGIDNYLKRKKNV